jgi:hypothetical protein
MKPNEFRPPILPVFLAVAILLLTTAAAFAQAGRGGIHGLVTDPTGAIVPGAKVVALSRATGTSLSTVSTAAGLYSFVSLSPGEYKVTASMKGFESVAQDNVTVSLDQVTTVNIALRVGAVTDTVTVSEAVDLVEASNSTVGQLISAETIDRVPLLNRDVFDLVQLSAGVTPANGSPNSSNSQAIINISNGRPGVDVSSYTINGAIEGSVYFMLDGSPLGVAEQNVGAVIPALQIPEDGVDESRVETQNTPASYQSGGAGVISLASKAGGDAFHGDAFVVLRPDVMAANDYFNKQGQLLGGLKNTAPDFHRYQEGGAFSGPILHKRLFFFGDYEATQQKMFDNSSIFTVPTSAERTGDFSNEMGLDANGLAIPITIYNPSQPDNPDGTRQAFAGNVITNPNPVALKFLSMFPKCNYPNPSTCDSNAVPSKQNNLQVPGLDPTTAQRFDIRVDYIKSDVQRLFARFSFDRLFSSGVNAFNNPWDLDYAQNITNGRNVLLADDLTLNPTTVLQLRYSFTRHYENQGGDPGQSAVDNLAKLGFTTPTASDELYKTLPYVTFNDVGGGIGGTANYNTFIYASENSDANATVTKIVGSHELSTGVEYMKRFLNVGQPPAPSGAYSFDISATDETSISGIGGSDFASFLVGMGTEPGSESYNFTKDLFVAEASPYYAAFIQDTWKPSKSLTITAGLRWDIFGGKTERHNRLEYFDPKAANNFNGVSYTGAEVYADSGNRSPFSANLTNFGPRLGLSWQPTQHLVVRGGGGFYYGPSAQMVASASLDSDGYSSVTNWNATAWNNDPNTIAFDGQGNGNTVMISPVNNPFPNGVVPLISAPKGLANNLGLSLNTMLHTQRTQETYNFNFGLEYEFPHSIVLSAGYVGSRGLFLPLAQVDLNQLDLGTIASNGTNLCLSGDPSCSVANTWANIQPSTNANYGNATVPLWVSLQPYPQFGDGSYGSGNGIMVHGYPGGDSEYSSLQTKLQKRLTQHFTTLASFTWAKLMTDDGNPPLGFVGAHAGAPQDWKNRSLEHAISPQDVKYQFTWDVSYDLPVGRGRTLHLNPVGNAILGDWTVNGVAYLSTGVPIDAPVVGASNPYFNQRTDMICDPSKGAPHTAAAWFNSSCFAVPANPFRAGTAPAYLDHVRTMGANDVDISLFKNFSLWKEMKLRLDISSYNVANKKQLGAPNVSSATAGYPLFGNITSDLNSPRQFQFGSRFVF